LVDTIKWKNDTGVWNDATAIFSKAKPVMIQGNDFYVADETDEELDHVMEVVVARSGLTIYARDQEGNPKSDTETIKSVQGIWPEIEAPPGTIVKVSVGSQVTATSPVQWTGPRDFVVGETIYLDFIVTGRYISVRFESLGQPVWVLSSYDLDIERSGEL